MRGLGAAAFAFMFALGGSTMAFLGAVHPFWRLNMIAMAVLAFLTMVLIATILTESPIWLLRKGRLFFWILDLDYHYCDQVMFLKNLNFLNVT